MLRVNDFVYDPETLLVNDDKSDRLLEIVCDRDRNGVLDKDSVLENDKLPLDEIGKEIVGGIVSVGIPEAVGVWRRVIELVFEVVDEGTSLGVIDADLVRGSVTVFGIEAEGLSIGDNDIELTKLKDGEVDWVGTRVEESD